MITVEHLTKRFGDHLAVDDLGFAAATGRITGFVGPNGAGKSTTLRAMVGLLQVDAGEVRYDGVHFRDLGTPATVVGALLDPDCLHPGRTARQHLRAVAALSGLPDARVDEVLREVGMLPAADRRAGGFSLGMRQRVALATALLGRPRVLLLDEPANGLDPQGVRWLRQYLRAFADAGGTVLVSSHLIAELATFVDDLVVIGAGRLLAAQSLAAIRAVDTVVVVATPQDAPLTSLLRARGLDVQQVDGELHVRGTDRTTVSDLAFDHGIRLYRLTDEQASLEDRLLDLTDDATTYATHTNGKARP